MNERKGSKVGDEGHKRGKTKSRQVISPFAARLSPGGSSDGLRDERPSPGILLQTTAKAEKLAVEMNMILIFSTPYAYIP